MRMNDEYIYNDYCHECKIHGDNCYYDKDKKEYVKLCNECSFNDNKRKDKNESSN